MDSSDWFFLGYSWSQNPSTLLPLQRWRPPETSLLWTISGASWRRSARQEKNPSTVFISHSEHVSLMYAFKELGSSLSCRHGGAAVAVDPLFKPQVASETTPSSQTSSSDTTEAFSPKNVTFVFVFSLSLRSLTSVRFTLPVFHLTGAMRRKEQKGNRSAGKSGGTSPKHR